MNSNYKKFFLLWVILLVSQSLSANNSTALYDQRNPDSRIDSLPEGFTDESMSDLRDEKGNKLFLGDESDAFLQRSFNGFASGDIYGWSVSSAGDVNGDGFDDIIIGAPQNGFAGMYAGRAYIYYGGINVNSVADVILTGEAANNFFGYSVSSAGDVNSDGYSDVLVGAYGYNSYTGRSYIYYGGQVMNNSPDVIMTGDNANDQFGYSVSEAGDVNGDGYRDILAGANGNNSYTGSAYIFYGGSSMDNVYDIIFYGEFPNDNYGVSVSTAGDVNGDGYSDVFMGASDYDSYTGKVYIYFGGSSMDNINDLSMTGENINNYFGTSAASAEDLNMDGYSDLVIGAPGANGYAGRAYVYYGGYSMNEIADVILNGENSNNEFGISVSSAGDVNGDGFADIIAGASSYSSFKGRAYVFFGGVLMNNTSDLIITGEATVTHFGYSVSKAGDVNGDGYSDVITGAYGFNSITGKAYLYMYGMNGTFTSELSITGASTLREIGASVSSAGDVNGDGYNDVIIGAPYSAGGVFGGDAYIYFGGTIMDNIADVSLGGEAASNRFGTSVSNAGDVNGDGYSDVIVGAWNYSSAKGRAYIFYGGASMNNTADVIMTGINTNDYFGMAVSDAGDVNGDGLSDVIVGSEGYSFNSSTGRAYIYYGGTVMNNSADVIMNGDSANNFFGHSVSAAGDVNGDGYSDVIIGARGYRANTGKAFIFYGGASMNSASDVTFTGEAVDDFFGGSVSEAGDVNGDGYSDVIVGAHRAGSGYGRAYIYFGSYVMNNLPDVVLTGVLPATYTFGNCVSAAGDINKDGYSDVIVGASDQNTYTGQAFIFYGGSAMNNISDVDMTGEGINTQFGKSVSSAGDLNGDGNPDLIIGAPLTSSLTGKTFIYLTSSPNVHPNILNATDVAGDQGGYLNLKFARSAFDVPLSETGGVNYHIERSVPPNMSGYQWISIASVSGIHNTVYTAELHTPLDSSLSGNNTYFFRITAISNSSGSIWRSNILSGYSVDNLAPLPPVNLIASLSGNSVNLNWNQNSENDLRQYIIFRNSIQIGTSTVLNFTDNSFSSDSSFIYRIAAEDVHGNISGLSNPANVNLAFSTINIKVIPEGFYNTSTEQLNMQDSVRVFLCSNVSSFNKIDSAITVIDSLSFTGTFKFFNAPSGTYYIVIRHRNSIETWSKSGGEPFVIGTPMSYNFTNIVTKAFGNNMKQVDAFPVRFGIYSGDVNQDGIIDAGDISAIENDASNSVSGYIPTDVTGDDFVDGSDVSIVENNAVNSVGVITP